MPRTHDSVRQANFSSAALADASSINGHFNDIEISDLVTATESEVLVEEYSEYPFVNQKVTNGSYRYDHSGALGRSTAEGSFEIRHKSHLFMLKKLKGSADIGDVVEAITSALSEEFDPNFKIHESYRPTREGIWEFVDHADPIHNLTLLYDTGEEITLQEALERTNKSYEELYGVYPVVEANMVFELPSGESANVIYKRGHFEISPDKENIHKYVIQRFECDVVANR